MLRKPASIIILCLVVVSTLALAYNVRPVKSNYAWTQTIYIRADGSIDPPTAPISSIDKVTYTLTDNIAGNVPDGSSAIIIQRNNIIIDGAGHTLSGSRLTDGLNIGINLTRINFVTIKNMKITTFTWGIMLYASSNNRVNGSSITNTEEGIWLLSYSDNNSVTGNNITNNGAGMGLAGYSDNNSVTGNNITANNGYGIYFIHASNSNNVSGNNITNNVEGIMLEGTGGPLSYNTFSGNNITNNQIGVMFASSSINGNVFFHNNFIGNTQQVASNSEPNTWDNGYPNGGNYWSDYTGIDVKSGPNQDQPGSDGIGDTPYVIDGNNIDHYPLMNPWSSTPPTHTVTFVESGLALGTRWTVYLEGQCVSDRSPSTSSSITFSDIPNGVYYYSVTANGFIASPASGSITVAGPGMTVPITFRVSYANIVIYKVQPATSIVYQGTVEINIGVTNEGTETGTFDLTIKEQMLLSISPRIPLTRENLLGTLHVSSLAPGSSKKYSFAWNTKGFSSGAYNINVYADISNAEFLGAGPITLQDIGYAMIVGGIDYKGGQNSIDSTCADVYQTLRDVGFSSDRIYYLSPFDQYLDGLKINNATTWPNDPRRPNPLDILTDAIQNWAANRVNALEPFFLYLFGHGAKNSDGKQFIISSWYLDAGAQPPNDWQDFTISSTDLSSLLAGLRNKTGAEICTICNFCYSGGFLSDLSPVSNITICSCQQDQPDYCLDNWNVFEGPFWAQIDQGKSIGASFNGACEYVKWACNVYGRVQTPLLDDDNDGSGHTGPLPNGGDGSYALHAYIGHCEWRFPWISSSVATQYSAWPPTGNITLWAKVENDSSLAHVEAGMIAPDWMATNDSGFVDAVSGVFEMTDQAGDGNYTVSVPAVNFTNHASGPSNFTFVIFAEQADNRTAIPCFVNVIFTETGQPPGDTIAPVIHITRPLDGSVVHGTIQVNGTTSDDVCLKKCELYVDGSLARTISLPQASSSYFDFPLDTDFLSNGNHTIMTESYDTSNNDVNESVSIYVVNDLHDVAIADVGSGEPVGFEGFNLSVTAVVVNHGSYAESTNITIYANSTQIGAAVFDNMTIDGLEILTFAWDTKGFASGNYTLSAYAWPVPGETCIVDNTYFGVTVQVLTIPTGGGGGRMPYAD